MQIINNNWMMVMTRITVTCGVNLYYIDNIKKNYTILIWKVFTVFFRMCMLNAR